jgi:adenine/guanine phosphoribosyltransferase-like PRPP-binding protein
MDHLVPQFDIIFDAMLIITRGGIIPGGLVADALGIEEILTASIDFPAESRMGENQNLPHKFLALPEFVQFPDSSLLCEKQVIIIDDVWGSGRTISTVKNRVKGAYGIPYTCVFHFTPIAISLAWKSPIIMQPLQMRILSTHGRSIWENPECCPSIVSNSGNQYF